MKAAPLVLTSLAALTILAGAGGPIGRAAAQQAPPPTTLTGMFEPDLADVKHPEALKAAVDQGRFKGDGGCYPPSGLRAKFTARMKQDGDRLFIETLAKARAEAIKQSLNSSGVDDSQFATDWEVGNDDDVRVTYHELEDTDPPVFYRLKSDPEKGTRVKAGDKITVSIVASERYEDGHKSWPTGVQVIQLLDNDGLVDSKAFHKPPPPCDRASFEKTYTVPDNPPKFVLLQALAEDGVGNSKIETGDFPTVAGFKFSGVRFDWPSYHFSDDFSGRVCGNPYKDPWRVSFTNTNTISGETGTVSLSGPGSGIQIHGETILSLTYLPSWGWWADLRVTRHMRTGPQEKTVQLEVDESCDAPADRK